MFLTRLQPKSLVGALAGLLATVPMSVFLLAMQRLMPRHERYPLPPFGQITNSLANKLGLGFTKNSPPHRAVTGAAHFSYGSAAGAVYASLPSPLRRRPAPWLSGLLFGLGIWFASYMGWLPALRILPPADHQPRERAAVMVIAHLVWGLVTGVLVNAWLGRRGR
jgi:hypothetical protein